MVPRFVIAFFFVFTACHAQVQHGLDERDANEIVSELVARGFEAKKVAEKGKKPTWAIELPEARATEALRVLTELKLPRKARKTTQSIVESAGLIETPHAERLRALEAQEGDLEEALETMDGVKSASVELVVPPPSRPGQAPTPSKASVLLRVHPDAAERLQQQRAELRALVAGGVDGLKPDDVVLVLDTVAVTVTAPIVDEPPASGLRGLIVVLALVLSLLAVALMVVFFRGRKKPAPISAAATTSTPRAVLSTAAQRRVA